ncbi:MAG: N(4)-(beta-N-acetylglucosaminyl)-L-asparaginase [Fidelibacterota bacterium]
MPSTIIHAKSLQLNRRKGAVVLSTWKHGIPANVAAMEILTNGGSALDAVEAGARVPEADPEVHSVGYGGIPDAEGKVTLDASIMNSDGNAGSVAAIENIKHPISVARLVMEKTPHVMLVGAGAKQFALKNGFEEVELLTGFTRQNWESWKAKQAKKTAKPTDTHDTIAILAQDQEGNLAGACTTSGSAFKLHGRVGDSPIIGAGMYVDNDVGAAGATGLGEEVIKTAGSFLVVELMRQGYEPEDACKEALQRIIKKNKNRPSLQVSYIALRIDGKIGAGSIRDGFSYALASDNSNTLYPVKGILGK